MSREHILTSQKWWYFCAAVYVLFFCYHALQAYQKPVWNWDMVFYLASAEAYAGGDAQQIYDNTIADGSEAYVQRGEAALKRFKEMKLWPDAEALHQQLPYYTIKPAYILSMLALHQFGMPLYMTTYILSILGFLAVGALCFYFRPAGIDRGLWWLAVVIFCAAGRWSFMSLPHWSTPDTMCTVFFIAGLCLWLYRHSEVGFGVCMLLSQLARPDAMMLTVLLAAFFALDPTARKRMDRMRALAIGSAAVTLYMAINYLTGNYGWANLFNYVFFHRVAYPAALGADFTLAQYVHVLLDGLWHLAIDPRVQALMAMSVAASAAQLHFPTAVKWHFLWLLWLAWAGLLARFILLPAWWEDRYYYPNYFIMLYASAELLSGAWRTHCDRLRLSAMHGKR